VQRLRALLGREHDLADVAREIRAAVRASGATGVGGFHVTCCDESEYECSDAFLSGFAGEMLPRQRYGDRVPFRLATPGARYAPGTVRIAEDHFATEAARRGFLALVVKINGHVALVPGTSGPTFGSLVRYDDESAYCGAVHAVLEESEAVTAGLPFVRDLRADLQGTGLDRLAALRAPALAADGRRALFGALALTDLQAQACVEDLRAHTPAGPTLYVVMACVTLNKPGRDTEIVAGLHVLDHRHAERTERYDGLGDDPLRYDLRVAQGRLQVARQQLDVDAPRE